MNLTKISQPRLEKRGNKKLWTLTYPSAGGRKRKRFATKEAARIFYEEKKLEIAKYGSADAFDDRQRADVVAALEILQPYGISILEAAKQTATREAARRGSVPLREAIAGFIESRTKSGCSRVYISSLKSRLAIFAEKFPELSTREITTETIDSFLQGLGTSAGNAAAYRRDIMVFFSHCEAQNYIDKNPVTRAMKFKRTAQKIEILTPAQCRELLDNCPDEIKGAVAVQMFCGLRAAEASRLQCDAIDAFQKVVTVDAGIAKTASRRTVPMNDAAAAWLMPYHGREGAIMPPNYRNLFDIARVKSGFKASYEKRDNEALQAVIAEAEAQGRKLVEWPQNALRHSAISYALADNGDIYKTATAAGNSPDIICSHYLHLVKPEDATAFYSIVPARAESATKRARQSA